MAGSQWAFKTASETAAALAAKDVSAVELTQATIDRIEKYDGHVNAICVRDFSRALEAARAADAAIARGEQGPLTGLPMTIKESYNLAGTPTTWGFVPQKDFIPRDDALAVQRVKAAGAVIVGKTNVPLGLGDWQSYNAIYGVTNNPYDVTRTPGGSSGGSAAALAAGYGPLSLGSDIGGSLRSPAHYCGVYAHKPTLQIVPSRGHTPPPLPPLPADQDLAVIGPMARSAGDLSLLLDVIAGPDEVDNGIAYRLTLPAARHADLKGYRILVLDTHPLLPTASSVRTAIGALADGLARQGAKVERQSDLLPDLASAARLYMRLLLSFLAMSFPPEVIARAQKEVRERETSPTLGPKDLSLAAERQQGIVMSHRDWLFANGARTQHRAQWRAFFKSFDALICPIMPTPAYPHDHSPDQGTRLIMIDDTPHPYSDQLIWPGVATMPGLPATSIPIGLSADGLPIGVQIVGPWLEDRTPLRLAELIEREFGGFAPPKGFD
ncbi:amidase [Bradyrhizobium sp. LHD-71]|uniref:amidase n=1 Tax=Bradyrhizobium sp. LHD-71 TaxID=3072141 RepID=UPI00280E46BF|nr:amidase [Bradyrhizobium sp. LHD-71]MDQ8730951.1 amidase [Bradyrhizobium sp. LHD-71]